MGKGFTFFAFHIKEMTTHRMDFILELINLFVNHGILLLFFYVIYINLPNLCGWEINELILLYGVFIVNKGIADFLTAGLYSIEKLIQKGDMDSYMVRPMPVLQQVLYSKMDVFQLVNIITGILLIGVSFESLCVSINWIKIVRLCIYSGASILAVFSMRLISMSIAFWTQTSFPVAISVDSIADFAKYPLNIYHISLEKILTIVFPYAFLAYYPTLVILEKDDLFKQVLYILTVIPSMLFLSLLVWKRGLEIYESSGH